MPYTTDNLPRVAASQPPYITNCFGAGLGSSTKTKTDSNAKPQANKFGTSSNQHQRHGADRNAAPYFRLCLSISWRFADEQGNDVHAPQSTSRDAHQMGETRTIPPHFKNFWTYFRDSGLHPPYLATQLPPTPASASSSLVCLLIALPVDVCIASASARSCAQKLRPTPELRNLPALPDARAPRGEDREM
jgi:hypothetical protein